jgi:hypothetical protein
MAGSKHLEEGGISETAWTNERLAKATPTASKDVSRYLSRSDGQAFMHPMGRDFVNGIAKKGNLEPAQPPHKLPPVIQSNSNLQPPLEAPLRSRTPSKYPPDQHLHYGNILPNPQNRRGSSVCHLDKAWDGDGSVVETGQIQTKW